MSRTTAHRYRPPSAVLRSPVLRERPSCEYLLVPASAEVQVKRDPFESSLVSPVSLALDYTSFIESCSLTAPLLGAHQADPHAPLANCTAQTGNMAPQTCCMRQPRRHARPLHCNRLTRKHRRHPCRGIPACAATSARRLRTRAADTSSDTSCGHVLRTRARLSVASPAPRARRRPRGRWSCSQMDAGDLAADGRQMEGSPASHHIVLPHTGTGQQHVITRVGACGMLRRWVSQLIP